MKRRLFLWVMSSVLILHCKSYSEIPYTYQQPEFLNDGIEVGTLDQADLDSVLILKALKRIKGGAYGETHAFLIYYSGKLILEDYFPGHKYDWFGPAFKGEWVEWDQSMPHSIMSDTKSITSACVGIAIDHGFIKSEEESIFTYLPDHQHLKTAENTGITIEHLLTMTSGMEWQEWGIPYNSINNPIIGIWYSEKDPVSYILEGEITHTPGTHFRYFGGNQILLGEIIKNASGLPLDEFSDRYLFEPLGVDSANWATRFNNGVIEAAGGLRICPRDMLKIGIMFLDNGIWDDKRILPQNWIVNSATPYGSNNGIRIPGEDAGKVSYGYSWWNKTEMYKGSRTNIFWAGGWGGQKIIVLPAYQLVVVFTGANYGKSIHQFEILEDYVIPAIR